MARTALILTLTLLALASAATALVQTPDAAPISVAFNTHNPMGSHDLALSDPLVVRTVTGINPDQVHITFFGLGEVLFSWVTGAGQVGPVVTSPPVGSVASNVYYGKLAGAGNLTSMAEGFSTTYYQDYSPNGLSYASALIHHVWIAGLTPGAQYFYMVGDKKFSALSPVLNFTVVAAPTVDNLPFTIGFIGDPGQTSNTSVTLQHMMTKQTDLFIITGDFTYSDDWQFSGNCGVGFDACSTAQTNSCGPFANTTCPKATYQPKWDSWTRLFSPLISTTPFLHCNGNHEIETDFSNHTQTSYNARFPTPFKGRNFIDPRANSINPGQKSDRNLYYSVDIPGAHVVFLTSYIPRDNFNTTSAQYLWLEADLAAVNRTVTPWLIAVFHAPWYNSFVSHYLENEAMRQAFEPLLYKNGLDLAFNGHVHAYTRTKPVYNNIVDPCGAVHITIGDGGNIEEVSATFIDVANATYCSAPFNRTFPGYQPQKVYPVGTTATGNYCYTSVPDWIAYRESSFGHGVLTIEDAQTASWTWNRNQDEAATMVDSVTWTRGGCSSRK